MDNPSTPKPIEARGAFGIPKWIMKKGMRYEVDDFIVSPPTDEDGGFMRLRYGRCPSPRRLHHHISPEDSTEQSRLGITVQVLENSSVSSSTDLASTTITFGPGVLSAEATPIITPTTSPTPFTPALTPGVSPTPLASIPLAPALTPGTSPTPLANAPLYPAVSPTHTPVSTPETELSSPQLSPLNLPSRRGDPLNELGEEGNSSPVDSHQQGHTTSVIARSFKKISEKTRPALESFLLEGENKDKGEFLDRLTSLSVGGTPEATPVPTPQSSPLTQRKVLGVAMENPRGRQIAAHSYFCTKPFQQNTEHQQGDSESTGRTPGHLYWGSQENKLSKTTDSKSALSSAVRNSQLQDGEQTAQALYVSGSVMDKKKPRPKPSKLREMNFWAPTSM